MCPDVPSTILYPLIQDGASLLIKTTGIAGGMRKAPKRGRYVSTTARLIALDNLQSAIFGHKRGFVASNQAMSRCRTNLHFAKL